MSRRPSARAHAEVLRAAESLFARDGIEATSMDAIAGMSGVSKATIYKHWKDKEALCLEVLGCLSEPVPMTDTDDVRADIIAVLDRRSDRRKSKMRNRIFWHSAAYARRNFAFGQAWRAKMIEPPRRRLIHLLGRAMAEGRLRADLEVNVGVALLLGPMMYRHATGFLRIPLPSNTAELVVEAFWRAYAAGAGSRRVRRKRAIVQGKPVGSS